ncbi:MAG: hypothetical protein FWC91_09525 [Defluviitaleaceae bacterium]|nr:hypothetical protein [Defluviitaleaceae bacterium]
MKKADAENSIKIIIVNPPAKEQAEERIKKLSQYLSEIWRNPSNIK